MRLRNKSGQKLSSRRHCVGVLCGKYLLGVEKEPELGKAEGRDFFFNVYLFVCLFGAGGGHDTLVFFCCEN